MHSPLGDRAAASSPPASAAAESSLTPSMQRASCRPLCGVQLCDIVCWMLELLAPKVVTGRAWLVSTHKS